MKLELVHGRACNRNAEEAVLPSTFPAEPLLERFWEPL